VIAAYGVVSPTWASAATLTGSEFEIDLGDANLVVDDPTLIDWLNDAGTDMREGVIVQDDRPTGAEDDSFAQGTNINDEPTTIARGSIPNNKSDLTHFGIYVESTDTESYVNVFWTRVQEPSGTTTMDFEFNQSEDRFNYVANPDAAVLSTETIPVRTDGDILITYYLEKGGDSPVLTRREWDDVANAWGDPIEFSAAEALAAINTSAIPASEADGLGALSPYTFGEASIALSALVPPSDDCTTFGSVYLRSRSSATDTDENKDFIAPQDVSISNCGSVRIHKTDANGDLEGAGFTAYVDAEPHGTARGAEDTEVAGTCGPTGSDGICTISDLHKGSYWIVETTVPTGHDPVANQYVTITHGDQVVPLTLNDPIQHGTIRVIKTADPSDGTDFDFTLDGDPFSLDDDNDSNATLTDRQDFVVVVGEHSLSEVDVPDGWANTALVCVDSATDDSTESGSSATVVVEKDELVTCTFTNEYQATRPDMDTTAAAAVANTSWNDTATLTGDGTHAVTGTVAFYVCGPTAAAAECASTANKVGDDVAVTDGSATTSTPYAPTLAGWYCFRAVYTSTSPYYLGTNHTNDSTECFLKRNANLSVAKTATAAFGRVYTWDVTKTALGDTAVEAPAGTTHSFDYSVSVSNTHTDSSWTVTGQITVSNPNNVAFEGVDVTDAIDNGAGTCAVPGGSDVTVPARSGDVDGTVVLDYTCTYASAPAPAAGTNTATASWDGAAYFTTQSQATGTANVDFATVTPSTTNQVVTVTDTLEGDLGTLDGATADNPTVFTYAVEQTAPDGSCATFPNTASVTTVRAVDESLLAAQDVVTLDSASASVSLCGGLPLGVGVEGGGSFDRTFLWGIDKAVDRTTVTVPNGGSATYAYTVTVTPAGIADDNYALSGTVSIENPNDWEDVTADVTVASDLGGGVTCAVADGEDAVIPADDARSFAYTCSFTGTPATTGTVTATATWDPAAAATAVGSTSLGTPVELVVATETNRTVTVVDDKTDPANPVELGTWNYDDGAHAFTYSLTKAGTNDTCVDFTNIASIVETGQSDTQVATLCSEFTGGGGGVGEPELPFTGDALGLLARTALALMGSGLLLLVLTRRRVIAG
jgi:hypothetical protein